MQSIRAFVRDPLELCRIERECSRSDQTLVRAAVFSLLHGGELAAPKLRVSPLSHLTVVEPTP